MGLTCGITPPSAGQDLCISYSDLRFMQLEKKKINHITLKDPWWKQLYYISWKDHIKNKLASSLRLSKVFLVFGERNCYPLRNILLKYYFAKFSFHFWYCHPGVKYRKSHTALKQKAAFFCYHVSTLLPFCCCLLTRGEYSETRWKCWNKYAAEADRWQCSVSSLPASKMYSFSHETHLQIRQALRVS